MGDDGLAASPGSSKSAKWVQRLALATAVLYAAFSAWRLATVKEYQAALEASFEEQGSSFFSELYTTSTELVYGNYVLLLLFALAIAACAYQGVAAKDKNLVKWHICANFGCILILIFTVGNLISAGDLCTSTASDCTTKKNTFVWSLVISFALLVLYFVSFLLAMRLYRSGKLEVTTDLEAPALRRVVTTTTVQVTTHRVQPSSNLKIPERRPVSTAQPQAPFATPVYAEELDEGR